MVTQVDTDRVKFRFRQGVLYDRRPGLIKDGNRINTEDKESGMGRLDGKVALISGGVCGQAPEPPVQTGYVFFGFRSRYFSRRTSCSQ